MTSKRETAAAKAARMTAVKPVDVGPEVAAVPEKRTGSGMSVRVSLDLPPALYADLTEWNRAAAGRVGRTRVTNAESLRALVRLLLDDAAVGDEVVRRLSK